MEIHIHKQRTFYIKYLEMGLSTPSLFSVVKSIYIQHLLVFLVEIWS